jgi:hypothetical protein
LQAYGNPLVPINAVSYLETLFSIFADLAYDPAYDMVAVKAAVVQALTQNYSLAARSFGQGVSADEVSAFIQAVPGVVAVNVREFGVVATSRGGDLTGGNYSVSAYQLWRSQLVTINRAPSGSKTRICAYLPVASLGGLPNPAEILVLDPDPKSLVLGVMS